MVNRLNFYNPQFYAMEALIWLRNRKGMASRVYRAFENERNAYRLGDTINIRRPARFTAAAAPASSFQDLKTGTVQVSLNQFFEVPFQVTDLELAYGSERLITDHLGPAVDALGNNLDQFLYGQAAGVPHVVDLPGSVASTMPATLASMRQIMVDNQLPQDGRPVHYMAAPTTVARCLGSSAFTQWQGAGTEGVSAQASGVLGRKFGFDFFESQNGPVLQADSVASISGTLTVSGSPLKNATSVSLLTSAAQTAVLRKGMVVAITSGGLTYKYAVTADTAASGNNWNNVPISPPLRTDLSSATWALVVTSALSAGSSYTADLVFHPNAIALAMVPLPMHGADMGARVFTATDPDSGISVRARLWYDARNAAVGVVLDMLYGGVLLDPDLALRGVVRA